MWMTGWWKKIIKDLSKLDGNTLLYMDFLWFSAFLLVLPQSAENCWSCSHSQSLLWYMFFGLNHCKRCMKFTSCAWISFSDDLWVFIPINFIKTKTKLLQSLNSWLKEKRDLPSIFYSHLFRSQNISENLIISQLLVSNRTSMIIFSETWNGIIASNFKIICGWALEVIRNNADLRCFIMQCR